MLEQVDLDQRASKATYTRRIPQLQNRLYDLERAVAEARIPVTIVFEGWAAAGKGSAIRVFTQRLDPRGCVVVPVTPPRTVETHYPWMWRFWQRVPAYGQMVVFDTSWYRRVLIDRIDKRVPKRAWAGAYLDITEFEEQLAADGTVFVKLWLHISHTEQARRLKAIKGKKLTAWQITEEDEAQHRAYDKYLVAVEEMLTRTDTPFAPWVIVESTDKHFAQLKILDTTITTLERALARSGVAVESGTGAAPDA